MAQDAKQSTLRYKYTSISADTAVKATSGTIHRIICTASSSLVLQVYDGASTAGTKILDSITLAAKDIIEINAFFTTGLWVEVVSGTGTITVLYN